MSATLFGQGARPWAVDDLSVGPYAERARADPKAWDMAVERAYGFMVPLVASRLSRGTRIVAATEAAQVGLAALNADDLKASATGLRLELKRRGLAPDLVARCFAHVREATRRHLGFHHHPVQLMGGAVMLRGRLAEMQTGEGKSITALLPAATAALAGVPVHVVTVNDYLAQRDGEELGPIYAALGLSAGLVQHGQDPEVRRAAYAADVTYCTNKEVAFDYLRDRMALRERSSATRILAHALLDPAAMRQPFFLRGLGFAVVDEADSVLIDEARTPLILSSGGPAEGAEERYRTALAMAQNLEPGRDYETAATERSIRLTVEGERKAKRLAETETGLWRSRRAREELLTQALSALHLFERDHQYIVVDDKVQIVDEFTGRVMADRKWQRGLQQLIEVKEGCPLSDGRETIAQTTYQRFFRRYLWLGGMTGTGMEVAPELRSVYGLQVVRIPTNRPSRRRSRGAAFFRTGEDRWRATVEATKAVVAEGRPVLIGTRSVAASEHLGALFAAEGLEAVVLNARQDRDEAEAVAEAGKPGRITVATNIAGRGTDIRLPRDVADRGGLHVILTEYHESARIDRQLIGRAGRQGDPGSYEALVSLEDELFRTFSALTTAALARLATGDRIPASAGKLLRRLAQAKAERVHARQRRASFKRSLQLDKALAFVNWTD